MCTITSPWPDIDQFPMGRIQKAITDYFFVWTVAAGLLALLHPPAFLWFRGTWIPISLGFIMLGMGITLTWDDFRRVATEPKGVTTGVALQYLVMPVLGWSLGYLFQLETSEAVGLILVACCPGGTASNVISFLARADLGLSVTMTALSTMASVLLTPMLSGALVGGRMDVDMLGLFRTTLIVVVFPVTAGLVMNHYFHTVSRRLHPFAPPRAVVLIILIVGSILAASRDRLLSGSGGVRLVGAVVALHALGFSLGYVLARLMKSGILSARTISIEVGMQNSGLGVELARRNFADPVTALPGALSALCHCVLGSLLAARWRSRPAENTE